MKEVIDLTGHRYGRLTVIGQDGKQGKQSLWSCRCDCGTIKTILGASLRSGNTTSCGCYRSERMSQLRTTHGQSNTPEYHVWSTMKQRCSDPTVTGYDNYGGRGISVHQPWNESFESFLADMGPRPSDVHTLERENVNGNYEPNNCTWIPKSKQSLNKRTNVHTEFQGRDYVLSELAKETGLPYTTLYGHVTKGISGGEAVTLARNNLRPPRRSPRKT